MALASSLRSIFDSGMHLSQPARRSFFLHPVKKMKMASTTMGSQCVKKSTSIPEKEHQQKKKRKGSKASGEERFNEYYHQAFGDRWIHLKKALLQPNRHVARINAYVNLDSTMKMLNISAPESQFAGSSEGDEPHFPAFLVPDLESSPQATRQFPSPEYTQAEEYHSCKVRTHYLMDLASIVAATMLHVQPGDTVCDLCAAPGGKSLILAESLKGRGRLVANDRSDGRCYRLRTTLDDYLPSDIRALVLPTNHDASRWHMYETNVYDKILLDAPCSSERHVMSPGAKEYMEQWSPSRTKRLASQQKALLWSAVQALKVGGRILYSTCALSSLENDGVIQKALKKNKGQLQVVEEVGVDERLLQFIKRHLPGIEKTEFGWMILPDRCNGWGPMYFSLLTKCQPAVKPI